MSLHSVGAVFKIANEKSITYDDIQALTDAEVHQMFFPEKHVSETLYKDPNYETVHSELKRTGVNLKLLWNEYKDKDSCMVELSLVK